MHETGSKGASAERPSLWLVLAAFAAIYFVWGSAFLAGRIAVASIPPLLTVALRCLAGGGLLYTVVRLSGDGTRLPWRSAWVAGVLFVVCGHGALYVGLRLVPSGVAALVEATIPVWMLLLAWLFERDDRPPWRDIAGVAVGLAGVGVLAAPWRVVAGAAVDPRGVVVLLGSAASWAAGSIYIRRTPLVRAPVLGTSMQLLAGGGTMLAVSLLAGELGGVTAATFTLPATGALVYLVLGPTLLGFGAYVFLLGISTPARVGSYAYVNPVVAVLLGWALADEPLTPRVLLATAAIVAGVVMIVTSRRSRRPRQG